MAANYDIVRIKVLPRCVKCPKPALYYLYTLNGTTMENATHVCADHLADGLDKVANS